MKFEVAGVHTASGMRIKPAIVEAANEDEARRKAEAKGVKVESVTRVALAEVGAPAVQPPPIPAARTGGYVGGSMVDGEELIERGRLHWVIFLAVLVPLIPALLFTILWLGVKDASAAQTCGIIAGVCWAFTAARLASRLIKYFTTEIAVTSRRVVAKSGLIRRQTREILIKKVETIDVDQGIVDRVIGSGTVTVRGTGSTPLILDGLIAPNRLREAIQTLMG